MITRDWQWVMRPGFAGPHGGPTRPLAMGRLGAVATMHPLASLAGLDVLREGGNAFDAAVAAAAVVPLVEPQMSGIGGIGAATVYHAASESCLTLNFEGAPPSHWPRPRFSLDVPTRGLADAWVPGVVAGWGALIDRYGTMKLDRLLRPAIDHARKGVPVSVLLSAVIEAVGQQTGPYATPSNNDERRNAPVTQATLSQRERFTADPRAAAVFMPGGRSLRPGETLVPDRLALTLETIAREGVQAFYRGSIARQIAEACAGQEGFITLADLAAYQPVWGPSLRVRYRDHEIHSTPWPSGGAQFLETFSLLAGFDLSSFGLLSTDHIHTFLETMKIAQADRMAHKGDPTFDPSTTILDDSYAARRSSGIDMRRAAPSGGDEQTDPLIGPTPVEATAGTNTTHLVAADRHGNLVSLTQSLGRHFGSRVIAGETGILMNSMGRRWSMPGIPAAPAIALAPSGAPAMTVGGVGPLIQAVPQMISNVIDFHLNPQAALEAPRFRAFKGFRVMMEARIPQSVRAELASRGHQCDVVGEWAFGEGQLSRGQMIIRDRSGALYAGSDPRGDGAAQAI